MDDVIVVVVGESVVDIFTGTVLLVLLPPKFYFTLVVADLPLVLKAIWLLHLLLLLLLLISQLSVLLCSIFCCFAVNIAIIAAIFGDGIDALIADTV